MDYRRHLVMSIFIDLPDSLFYTILTFSAALTDSAAVLCHTIAPLSSSIYNSVENERYSLWSIILHKEYGGSFYYNSHDNSASPRRASKSLRKTAKESVWDAHLRLCHRTEFAHCALAELAHSKRVGCNIFFFISCSSLVAVNIFLWRFAFLCYFVSTHRHR